jgi:hypothetical protein
MTYIDPNAVERFDPFATYEGHATMCRASDGDYVSHTDYAALSAQLEDANSRHAAALKAVARARDDALNDAAHVYLHGSGADSWGFFIDAYEAIRALRTPHCDKQTADNSQQADLMRADVTQAASVELCDKLVELCDKLVDVMHKGEWPATEQIMSRSPSRNRRRQE